MYKTIKTQKKLENYQKEIRERQYETNPVTAEFVDGWDNLEHYNWDVEYIKITRVGNHELIERIKY